MKFNPKVDHVLVTDSDSGPEGWEFVTVQDLNVFYDPSKMDEAHEVGLREKLQQSSAFKSGASAAEQAAVEPSGARSDGAIKKLLRDIFSVNSDSIAIKTDENGEPLSSEIARFQQETGFSN